MLLVVAAAPGALVDPGVIDGLYRASEAGVRIDLLVRGTCSLVPGIPGTSETIRVRSIVGRYLEHSRILYFRNAGEERYFIGSADMMERNLDRRVEVVAPIDDPLLQARLKEVLGVMLADDRRAWELGADREWRRVEASLARPSGMDTFEELTASARASTAAAG